MMDCRLRGDDELAHGNDGNGYYERAPAYAGACGSCRSDALLRDAHRDL